LLERINYEINVIKEDPVIQADTILYFKV